MKITKPGPEKVLAYGLATILFAVISSAGAFSALLQQEKQEQKTDQGQPTGQSQQGSPAPAQPPSAEEQKAISDMQTELNPDTKIEEANDFIKKFPQSKLLTSAYSLGALGYAQKNDFAHAVEYCEKSKELNPNNLAALMFLAGWLPQPQVLKLGSELDKGKKLSEAEDAATHALQLTDQIPKQTTETDEAYKKRKDQVSAELHADLAMVHLQRSAMTLSGGFDAGELGKAEEEFKNAVTMSDPPSGEHLFRLGEVYYHEDKLDEAIQSFTRAGELEPRLKDICERNIEKVKAKQTQPKKP